MNFDVSAKVRDVMVRVDAFMSEHIVPNESRYLAELREGDRWQPTHIIEVLKDRARRAGLWNLFLPEHEGDAGLTNLEYACVRDHGAADLGGASFQLLGAGYRQHGSAGPIWLRGAAHGVAHATS